MKQIILALVLGVGFGPAFADGDVLAPLKLSSKCEDSIFKKAEGLCNVDSKSDPARDHDCLFWGDVNILRNGDSGAYFELEFTVTDADVYTYGVSVQDKDSCEFSVVSKNN